LGLAAICALNFFMAKPGKTFHPGAIVSSWCDPQNQNSSYCPHE
jgi:hypothetical protein